MNIVLYGEEVFLMEQKLESLKKKFDISDEQMNLSLYWCNETAMKDIIEDARTPSFLSEYKMVVLKNPLFLTTQKQKDVTEEDMQLLLDYVSNENPSTLFVIYHTQDKFDERKKIVKNLRKKMEFVHIEKLNEHRLFQKTREAVKARGCEISEDALHLLLSRTSRDLLTISKEVDKLCLYSKTIEKEDVDKLVPKQLEDNVFELTSAILSKNTKKSLQIYKDLVVNNEEPIKLIILIANSMRLLYQVKILDRKGYNDQEIGRMLGVNPYRLKYVRQDAKNYEVDELLFNIHKLSKLDVSIKTGQVDRFKGLEMFLIQVGG